MGIVDCHEVVAPTHVTVYYSRMFLSLSLTRLSIERPTPTTTLYYTLCVCSLVGVVAISRHG